MSTQSKRLGKGLGALLGESAVVAARAEAGAPEGSILQAPVGKIRPNRYQPRTTFDEEAIRDLAASIAQKGVLQPLIVTPTGEGGYELVSGERRLRAARRVGLSTVPVVVRKVEDRELLEIALIENLQREDLDPIEEAGGYRQLIDEFGLTQTELATELGKSRPAIANALRLLDLPADVQQLVQERALSAGHARALLGLADGAAISQVAAKAARQGMTVRQVERLVRRESQGPRQRVEGAPSDQLERSRIQDELQRTLGTKVTLHATSKGKGTIEIAFYSFDDLERLLDLIRRVGG